MGLVDHLELLDLQIEARHSEVDATFSLVKDRDGIPHLQIDTYGSHQRKLLGKKSQTIRFTPKAVTELKAIIEKHFGSASRVRARR